MTFMIVVVLSTESLNLTHWARGLHWAFLLFPHYALSSALQNINVVHSTYKLCNGIIDTCSSVNSSVTPDMCKFIICKISSRCCSK